MYISKKNIGGEKLHVVLDRTSPWGDLRIREAGRRETVGTIKERDSILHYSRYRLWTSWIPCGQLSPKLALPIRYRVRQRLRQRDPFRDILHCWYIRRRLF